MALHICNRYLYGDSQASMIKRIRKVEKYMRKRFLTIVMSLVLTVSMLTGCGNSKSSDSSSESSQSSASVEDSSRGDASSNTNSDSSSNSDNNTNNDTNANSDESEYTVYGKVTKVSNGKVTYEVLEKDSSQPQMPQGSGAPDAKNGEKPQKPQGSGAPDAKNGEKPQKPQGSGAPDAKNGEKPQMPQESGAPDMKNGGGIPGFKSTVKKSTVTIGSSVTVQKSGMDQTKTDASVSDIKKGSIIGLAFDGDNVTKVLIRENNGKMGKPDDNNNSGNAQNSSDNNNSGNVQNSSDNSNSSN